ncbi:MAG: hypothetical protein LBW85_00980 [Deltaproteobacteria bacterium]|jgi:hypothetical protein|nr:hypothetical protein [Deltaproteobacteria bacterium]
MTIATLENDPERGSGWALLRVDLAEAASGAVAGGPPGEGYSFSVRDAQSGEYLQKPGSRAPWGLRERFFRAGVRKAAPGELALVIPPQVTERLVENLFFFSVKGPEASFPDLMVQAGHILTASTPILLAPPPDLDDDGAGPEAGEGPGERLNAPEGGFREAEGEDGYGFREDRLSGTEGAGPGGRPNAPEGGFPEVEGEDGYGFPEDRLTGEESAVPGASGSAGAGGFDAPMTETEAYGVPAGLRRGLPLPPEARQAMDDGPGPFFPPEDPPAAAAPGPSPEASADPGRPEAEGLPGPGPGGLPEPSPALGRRGPGRALALASLALLLSAAGLYLFLWKSASDPISPAPPAEAAPPLPNAPPDSASVPREGCWAADGLEGAAPGGPLRKVLVQFCFGGPGQARLTLYELDSRGGARDACSSAAAVTGSGDGILISGDPEGPVCSREPDTSYHAMSLSCRPAREGEVSCLIEAEGGEPPLEAVFTRRS